MRLDETRKTGETQAAPSAPVERSGSSSRSDAVTGAAHSTQARARKAGARKAGARGASGKARYRNTGNTGANPGVRDTRIWRSSRSGMFSAARLAVKRLTNGRALLLAVALGMLVADALICTVPLYNALISDVQFQHILSAGDASARNLEAQTTSIHVSTATRATANAEVTSLGKQYLSSFTAATPTYYTSADTFLLSRIGKVTYDPTAPNPPEANPLALDYASAGPHMTVIAGRFPQATSAGALLPEAMITQQMATREHIGVGDELTLAQFGAHQDQLTARIVGVFTPRDPNDNYWNGLNFDITNGVNSSKPYPVLLSFSAFFSVFGGFNGVSMTQHWVYYTQPQRINAGNLNTVLDQVGQFRSRVNGDLLSTDNIANALVNTQLDQTINNLNGQQSLIALPLYVVVAQVVGLALLFVAAMASLLIDGQAGEIATLKSRGASGAQILGIFTTQGLLLGILAALLSPFIAALLSLALVHFFVPPSVFTGLDVNGAYFAQLASPQAVALPAILGALLGVGAVIASAWQSARRDVLAFRREQGRSTQQPFWQRYYLDLALVALCIIGYLELGQFGSASVRVQLGGSASPLLLITPALLLLAGALVTLRLVPLGARLGESLAARGRGLVAMLSLSQVERSPGRYTRMTLLLTLAVGLGLFALSFSTSLTQNIHDQAAYTVGANIRLTQNFPEGGQQGPKIAAQLAKLPGVTAVAPVYRTQAVTTSDQGGAQLTIMAVDPTKFASVVEPVAWRSDYASGASLSSLMQQMRAHQADASLAGSPGAPMWALVSQSFATQYNLTPGKHFEILLTDDGYAGTSCVVGAIVQDFPTLYPAELTAGFVVVSLPDYLNTVSNNAPSGSSLVGPNEFWLRTNGNAAQEQTTLDSVQANDDLDVKKIATLSLRQQLSQAESNPVNSGLRGLLIVGAIMAAALAIIGSIVQTLLAAGQRSTQFAVLRTLGVASGELTRLLLGEQLVVYIFGLVAGTALGVLLTTATLPFLQFSDQAVNPAQLGVPPYTLVFNWPGAAIFYLALLAAFVVALAIAARYAATIGLGKALRLGED
ncbi:MAG: FtsX-like permease family protein [Ktedonobacterales bacterium]